MRHRYYLMRLLTRFQAMRTLAPRLSRNPKPDLPADSLFNLDPETVTSSLKRDGIFQGLTLPRHTLSDILEYSSKQQCYGNNDLRNACTYGKQNGYVTGTYYNTHKCEAVRRLTLDPLLWEVAEKYLGRVPAYIGNQMWWSFRGVRTPTEKNIFGQLFHYDVDDFRFIKFFFYLTDVDEGSGPHVFVKGTHKSKILKHKLFYRRLSDDEVIKHYGEDNIVAIRGRSGTGFCEDTFGLHKGVTPVKADRLVLQIQFALFDYGLQHNIR